MRRALRRFGLSLALALPAAGHATPRRLVVFDLRASVPIEAQALQSMADTVRGEALALPSTDWFVLTREAVVAAFEADGTLADCVDDCELEAGRRLGAEVVISGELGEVGARLTLTLKAHEARSGRFLAQRGVAIERLEGLPEATADAARALLAQLAPPRLGEVAVASIHGDQSGRVELAVDEAVIGEVPRAPVAANPGARLRLSGPCVVSQELPGPAADESLQLHLAFEPQLRPLRLSVEGRGGVEPARLWVDDIYRGPVPGTVEVPVCGARAHVRGEPSWGFDAPLPPPTVEEARLWIPEDEDSRLGLRIGLAMAIAGGTGVAGWLAGRTMIGSNETFSTLGIAGGLALLFSSAFLAGSNQ